MKNKKRENTGYFKPVHLKVYYSSDHLDQKPCHTYWMKAKVLGPIPDLNLKNGNLQLQQVHQVTHESQSLRHIFLSIQKH